MTYVHQLDPVIVNLFGSVSLRWYGTAYLLGFLVCYYLIQYLSKKGYTPLKVQAISDLITYGVVGTMVGGRLGYVFFYSAELLTDFRSNFPFWGVLAVHEGGMASHGGMIGIAVAMILYGRKISLHPCYLFDLVTLTGCFGVFFGRIANFINGELVGRVVEGSHWWVIKFPTDLRAWSYARLIELKDVVHLVGVEQEAWTDWLKRAAMDSEARRNVQATVERLIQASQEHQPQVIAGLARVLDGRYPSQIYAAVFEGLFVFFVQWVVWAKPRKPGLIGATFVVTYACARIFTEQFRLPDAHIGYQFLGLTRGQWLSAGMLMVGVVLWVWWSRSKTLPAYGGWFAQSQAARQRSKT